MLSCVRYSENIDKLLLRGGGGGVQTHILLKQKYLFQFYLKSYATKIILTTLTINYESNWAVGVD